MSTTSERHGDDKKDTRLKAYVIGNLGDPGLDNDLYCDIKSRFVVAIINPNKIPFVLKYGAVNSAEPSQIGDANYPEQYSDRIIRQNNIILVRTPPEQWIDASTLDESNLDDIYNEDYSQLVRTEHQGAKRKNIGSKNSYISEEIPRLNRPYKFLEEITVVKLKGTDIAGVSSPNFQSFFPLMPNKGAGRTFFANNLDMEVIPNGYYDGTSADFDAMTNSYGEPWAAFPILYPPQFKRDPSTNANKFYPADVSWQGDNTYLNGNYFYLGYSKLSYEQSINQWYTDNPGEKYGINIDNLPQCWMPGGAKVPTNYVYAFLSSFNLRSYSEFLNRRAVSFARIAQKNGKDSTQIYNNLNWIHQSLFSLDTPNFVKFSACSYEEEPSDRKREATSACIPNVVVSPTDFATPQERQTSLIDFNVKILF
jgi:hypothetical protein